MANTITISFNNVNVSAQVGDIAYYSPISTLVGFDTLSTSTTVKLGEILAINASSITVEYDSTLPLPPLIGSFVFFVKNHVANTSSLLGYYADVKFENNSKVKAELFAVSSEVTESSK
jgi:hypothetical protein